MWALALCLPSCLAVAPFIAPAGLLASHAAARAQQEDLSAADLRLTMEDAEQVVLAAYDDLGIKVVSRRALVTEVRISGEDPGRQSIETQIRQMDRGFVRVSCQVGSTIGDIVGQGNSTRAQADTMNRIQLIAGRRGAGRLAGG